MLLRALVVLLVILNFGVAVWWALRGAPGDAVALADAAGPSTLQLVGEGPAAAALDVPSPVEVTPDTEEAAHEVVPTSATPQAAEPAQCFALGPFADAASRDAAVERLAPVAVRLATREVGETPRGWRVWMVPLVDRASADAMVARLLKAGFNDYDMIADGREANGIELGRFDSEAPARAHAQALRAAGFEVEVSSLGSTLERYWIDSMAAEGDTAEVLRTRAGAPRADTRDCDAQWDAG